jgi:hypothetical protein
MPSPIQRRRDGPKTDPVPQALAEASPLGTTSQTHGLLARQVIIIQRNPNSYLSSTIPTLAGRPEPSAETTENTVHPVPPPKPGPNPINPSSFFKNRAHAREASTAQASERTAPSLPVSPPYPIRNHHPYRRPDHGFPIITRCSPSIRSHPSRFLPADSSPNKRKCNMTAPKRKEKCKRFLSCSTSNPGKSSSGKGKVGREVGIRGGRGRCDFGPSPIH